MKPSFVRVPLFGQMFALLLGTVAVAQGLTVGALSILPAPRPEIHSIAAMAQALRSGETGGGRFRIERWNELPPGPLAHSDLAIARRFATELGVPPHHVRVRSEAGRVDVGGAFQSATPALASGAEGAGDAVLGPLIVAVRKDARTWHSVRSVSPGLERWRINSAITILAIFLVVLVPAWILSRRIIEPVKAFALAAERVGRNPGPEIVELRGPPELDQAATAFNAMQQRIRGFVEERTTMIAGIAHDLRTPLMRLGMRLGSAPAPLRASIQSDIEDMDQRLRAVMSLVRDINKPPETRKIDLRAIAESVVADAVDNGYEAFLSDGRPVIMQGDPASLKAMISNLVANACCYAGGADIVLEQSEESVSVEVLDRGPGAPNDDLEALFAPFVRGTSGNGDAGGTGLGLASVRAICRAHGGDAMLVKREGGGLIARATVRLAPLIA